MGCHIVNLWTFAAYASLKFGPSTCSFPSTSPPIFSSILCLIFSPSHASVSTASLFFLQGCINSNISLISVVQVWTDTSLANCDIGTLFFFAIIICATSFVSWLSVPTESFKSGQLCNFVVSLGINKEVN